MQSRSVPSAPLRQAGERISFNRPSIEGRELEHIREAIEGGHSSAKGPFSAKVAELLSAAVGGGEVLLTTSCTAALELSAMLLDLKPGDEVIVPSFTFVTTALAFARAGAKLRFADIESETLGLDPGHVADLMGPRVRAVVPVHYAGVGCDLASLVDVTSANDGVALVEDNAHGLFATYRGQPLGSFGRFATLSFHETKNFVCGEGGALIVNQANDVARAHVLYDKGTNRRAFLQGAVDKYTWIDEGSSFGLSDLLAAYLLGQLEAREVILRERRRVFERYESLLAPHAQERGFRLPVVPADRSQAYHMFYVLCPDRRTRDGVLSALSDVGVQATFHYVPLHDSPGARGHRAVETDCPVTVDVSGRLLRLPFYNSLTDADVDRVCDAFLTSIASF